MTDAASVPADAPQPPLGAMGDAPAASDREGSERVAPEDPTTPGSASAPVGLDAAGRPWPPFAHGSEAEMARILDFYEVRWDYEPRTFPILWNLEGDVVESFSPDFYLPDLDLFLEMTTLKQRLVRKKNRKLRRLRELYPDVRIKLFYARDFRAMLLKYGRFALADSLSGTLGQVMPERPREDDLGIERVIDGVVDLTASLADPALAGALTQPEPQESTPPPTPEPATSPAATPATPAAPRPEPAEQLAPPAAPSAETGSRRNASRSRRRRAAAAARRASRAADAQSTPAAAGRIENEEDQPRR